LETSNNSSKRLKDRHAATKVEAVIEEVDEDEGEEGESDSSQDSYKDT
jgi:hypothetical protein